MDMNGKRISITDLYLAFYCVVQRGFWNGIDEVGQITVRNYIIMELNYTATQSLKNRYIILEAWQVIIDGENPLYDSKDEADNMMQ